MFVTPTRTPSRPNKRRRIGTPSTIAYSPGVRRQLFTPQRSVQRVGGNPLLLGEGKYFDTGIDTATINQVGGDWTNTELDPAGFCLFYPSVGNQYFEREGRKVYVKKIAIRGFMYQPPEQNQTSLAQAPSARVLVYMDKQTNGTQAQGEDVVGPGEPANTTNIPSGAMDCFLNPVNFGRFKILKDKTFHFQPQIGTYDGTNMETPGQTYAFKWMIKFKKPILVNYNQTNGGSIADIVDNSFHLIAGSSTNGVAPALQYWCRTYFCERI